MERIKKYVINPVEAREASLETVDTLQVDYPVPADVEVLKGFLELDEQGLVPAEAMIAGMAELTGWNLDLADEITSGPGGMTVSFADTCSIFTGPPDPQKEEFHVYDAGELAATILDSIQHTLQYNFVDPEKGEPSSLDIYYCDAAGESITIPGLDVTIPMDTPYSGLAMA